jgi:signal peptidase I
VPADHLVGKAVMVLASWREGASPFKPWTWATHLRRERLFRSL